MTPASPLVRPATPHDGAAIAAIYAPYVEASIVTFEEIPPTAAAMTERLAAAPIPWVIAEREQQVIGYATVSAWKPRSAYRFAVEFGVYVAPAAQRSGAGSALYRDLLARCAAAGIHTVLAGIALPNDASVAMHERLGFAHVGTLREVGFKFARRIDVGYWQRQVAIGG
jgi:L-amino acid N-acyltransferase YncA